MKSLNDLLIGGGLVTMGVGAMGVIMFPWTVAPPHDIFDRWPDQPWQSEDISNTRVALVAPAPFDPALLGPEGPLVSTPTQGGSALRLESHPVAEHDAPRERSHDKSSKPTELCYRHGMTRVYFHRHHRLVWRCK